MMASLQANHHIISISSRHFCADTKLIYPVTTLHQQKSFPAVGFKVTSLSDRNSSGGGGSGSGSALVQQRPPSTDEDLEIMIDQTAEVGTAGTPAGEKDESDGSELEYLVKEYGWKVRRMAECSSEMKKVADIQAEAFHVPGLFFDDFFFYFFQAEVLAGLLYRLRNSPPDRYACLVAKSAKEDESSLTKLQRDNDQLVGVVDVTVLRDADVLRHLDGAQEYVYVSGIAVPNNYRRQKVATVLLQACEVISMLWGHEYLVLRAYEVDSGARALYTNAGFRLVSRDPIWVTWIGRKRRILMVKKLWVPLLA